MEKKIDAEVTGPDDDCDVWLNLDRDGHQSSINLGHPDEPIAQTALKAAGKEADPACTPVPHTPAEQDDLTALSDIELIMRYETTAPDNPEIDRIANVMQERGLDYPEAP